MNTTIENMLDTELSFLYRSGYDDGYNHGLNNIYHPNLEDADYLDGYNDGQTDACEYSI